MSKQPEKITINYSTGGTLDLDVEEFHPYEPAAYVHDPGWTCFSPVGTEYFISLSGIVYLQPSNIEVGIAPDVKRAADEMERQLTEAVDHSD